MTESQKQFELWCRNNPLKTDKDKFGGYKYQSTHIAFMAWESSRANLIVDLPDYEPNDHHRNIIIDEVKTTLEAAGVSYE